MAFILFVVTLTVTLALSQKRDTELASFCRYIADHITGNANFPTLQAQMADLSTLIDQFSTAIDAVKFGPPGSAAAKDALRMQLEGVMKNLSSNCILIANGDRAVLESSGFTLRRSNSNHDTLLFPDGFMVEPTTLTGQVRVKFITVDGAKNYMLFIKAVGEPEVITKFLTDGRGSIITDLQSSKEYEFKIKALGKGEVASDWSNIVVCKVY